MTRNTPRRFTGELGARITLARAISADLGTEICSSRRIDYEVWTHRIRTALDGLVSALDASTAPLLDGGAYISGPDLMTILGALRDGAEYRRNNPDDSDLASVASYRLMSYALGDDR